MTTQRTQARGEATVEVEITSTRLPQGYETYQGILTTDHAQSSYGLPVLLIGAARQPVGPAEVRRVYTIEAPLSHERAVIEAARRAGYVIDQAPDTMGEAI